MDNKGWTNRYLYDKSAANGGRVPVVYSDPLLRALVRAKQDVCKHKREIKSLREELRRVRRYTKSLKKELKVV